MGIVQKDAVRTSIISFAGIGLGYLNKAVLFVLLFSTAQVGLLNLLMSVGLLFAQFANLGTIYTTWRFFPFFRNPAKHHYGFLLANFFLVIIGSILFTGLLYLLKPHVVTLYSAKSPLFLSYFSWIVPLGIALVVFQLFENYLRGMGKNVLPVMLQEIVLRLCMTLILGLFAFQFLSFQWFVGLFVVIHFIPAIYLLLYLWRSKELIFSIKQIQIPAKFQRLILSYSGFSYINSLATLLVISMDALMIAQLIGLDATGVYTTMLFLISAVVFPYRSIMRVATPLVAKLWKDRNRQGLQELYQKSSSVGLLLGLFGFLGVWVVIDPLLSMVPAYQTGKWVFFILMLGRLIDMYFGLNGIIFSTSKKYKIDLIFTICLIASVYFANLWLIPIFGIVGAAISTSSAYLLYNIFRGFYIQRHYRLFPYQWVQLKLFLLGITVFFLFSLLGHVTADWWPMQPFAQIIVNELVLFLVFVFPIFIWNLEPETVGYIQGLRKNWRLKKS